MAVTAVLAEPYFSNVGHAWGSAAAQQLEAMCRAVRPLHGATLSVPATSRIVVCGVECPHLHAGQQPVSAGAAAGIDLSAFNDLRARAAYTAPPAGIIQCCSWLD
jgi:hypothetical protein